MEARSLKMNKTQKFSNEHQLDQDLCGITGGTYRTTKTLRSKASILKQIPENVRNALTGNKWEIIRYDPLVFIIAHTDLSQIVKGSVHEKENRVRDEKGQSTGETKTTYSLKLDDVLIAAYPLEIISHENPLGFTEHRYTIRFRSHTGRCFTIGPKTIEEIITGLRERALVFVSRGAAEALSTIIGAFAKDNQLVLDEDIETPGFYLLNNRLVAYHVNHPRPTKRKIRECCDLLDTLIPKFRCEETVPTIVKWGIISPFDYALKQYTNDAYFLPWPHAVGWTRTGKTTLGGTIVNGIWNRASDRRAKIPFSSADSEAKLGYVLSQSTYPITINEVSALADERNKKMLEMVKNSIETRVARSKHLHKTIYADIQALSPCVLTSNSPPPRDPGYMSKIILFVLTKQDRPTIEEKKEFDRLIAEKGRLLRVLGDFTANYLIKHSDIILRKNKEECDWKQTAKEVVTRFYLEAGRPPPSWIDYIIEERQLDDNVDDTRLSLRSLLIDVINESYNKYFRMFGEQIVPERNVLIARLMFCCDRGLIPSITTINNGQTVIIFSSIMKEIRNPRSGLGASEIASLQELANLIGLDYRQKWLNGNNTRVAYGSLSKLISFLDSEIKDENPSNAHWPTRHSIQKDSSITPKFLTS